MSVSVGLRSVIATVVPLFFTVTGGFATAAWSRTSVGTSDRIVLPEPATVMRVAFSGEPAAGYRNSSPASVVGGTNSRLAAASVTPPCATTNTCAPAANVAVTCPSRGFPTPSRTTRMRPHELKKDATNPCTGALNWSTAWMVSGEVPASTGATLQLTGTGLTNEGPSTCTGSSP